MSRCFPYPPPAYVRNPVAVAEAETTAKLQKERGKAEKKKERSGRKALQHGETSKHSKHGHKKRKHEDIGTVGQEPKMVSKESIEQLEKSGLTEEHGAPCSVQTARDSPESSQDSSKRRKIVLPSPSQAKNGNILRIKIKREPDSPRGVLEKPVVPEQPPVKQMGLGSSSSQLSKLNPIQQHNKVDLKPATAAPQRINVEPRAILKQSTTRLPSKFTRRADPQMAKFAQQRDSKLFVKPPVGRMDLQPARVDPPLVKMSQRDLPSKAAPAKVLHRIDPQVPSTDVQRRCPTALPKVLQESSTAPAPVQNLKLEAPGIIQSKQPIVSVSKEESSSTGRKAEAVQGQEVKQSKSDRMKSRKAEKKEKKFRDLFVTWNTPSFEMEDSDVGAQDWLFGSTKNSDASMTSCRASDGSVLFQSMEQQPSLQPRATFLPGLDVYQLPYVVPF